MPLKMFVIWCRVPQKKLESRKILRFRENKPNSQSFNLRDTNLFKIRLILDMSCEMTFLSNDLIVFPISGVGDLTEQT